MLSEQQQRILGYFIEEAKDHLNTIEQGLLSLQNTIEDPEMVSEVFRAAHSVKGGAAMLGLNSIQHTSHRLEDYFKVLKECTIRVDQKLETLLLEVFDALKELLEQLQGPFGLTEDKATEVMAGVEPVFHALNQHLGELVSLSGGKPPEDVELAMPAVAAKPERVSEVRTGPAIAEESALQFVFKSDVPARLRDMLQLFKQPEQPQVRQQLQDLCQFLSQAGEPFELTAWVELLRQAQRAIASPDHNFRTLAPILIKEIKQAQELVLSGRAAEIAPSEVLRSLLPPEPQALAAEAELADLFGVGMDEEAADLLDLDLFAEPEALPTEEISAETVSHDFTFVDQGTFVQTEEDALAQEMFAGSSEGEQQATDELGFPANWDETPTFEDALRNGPEVGMAELNSLADLFEGEMPDLGLTWQEEEVLSENLDSSNEALELEATNDFSDLFFEAEGDELVLEAGSPDEDLSGLFNQVDQLVNPHATTAVPEESFWTDTNPTDSEADLVDEMPAIPFEETDPSEFAQFFENPVAGGISQVSEGEPDVLAFDQFFEQASGAEAASSGGLTSDGLTSEFPGLDSVSFEEDQFGNLGELFAELDENVLIAAETPDAADAEVTELEALGVMSAADAGAEPGAIADFDPTSDIVSSFGFDEDFEAEETQTVGDETGETASDSLMDALFGDVEAAADSASPVVEEAPMLTWMDALDSEAGLSLMEPAPALWDEIATPPDDVTSDLWASSDDLAFESLDLEEPAGLSALEELEGLAELNEPVGDPSQEPVVTDGLTDSIFDAAAFDQLLEVGPDQAEVTDPLFGGEAEAGVERSPADQPEVSQQEAFDFFSQLSESEAESDLTFEAAFFASEPTESDSDALSLEAPVDASDASMNEFANAFADAFFDGLAEEAFTPEALTITTEPDSAEIDLGDEADFSAAFEIAESPEAISGFGAVEAETPFEMGSALADLDALLIESEEPSEAPLMGASLEVDVTGASLDQLDVLLGQTEDEEMQPFTGEVLGEQVPSDFADLDSLLNESLESPSEPALTLSLEPEAALEDEFLDLESILAEEPSLTSPPFSASEPSEFNDFADLEALLDEEPVPTTDFPSISTTAVPATSDDEFGDLERLLENADQTLGGTPTSRSSRGPAVQGRRPTRPGVLTDQTMRVSVKNLDNLNNLVGELVVNRNSLEQAEERLRQFLDNLLYQVQQLSDVGQRMRDLYERSLLESSLLSSRRTHHAAGNGTPGTAQSHATGMSFDALEMDRFTGFHTLSQEMIELIVRVRESASDIDFVVDETDQITRNFRQITTQLQEGLTRSRMVPFAQTADRLPRAVRDISLRCGKQAELTIEGRETLIDKMILEQLYDPMTHLVNNAITHGIETPEERTALGKPPIGKITVRTFHQGNQTVISVTDDGAGIDPERVKVKALEKGLITAEDVRSMTRLDVYDLLFHHGFSTRDRADDFAGRGVGMDVVRTSLNEIRGSINIDSAIGRGTTFTIRLPLTLSISKALCCISNRARIAFPMDGVEDMLDIPRDRIQTMDDGRSCIQWRDTTLPFQHLSDLLKHNRSLGRGSVYGGNQEEDIVSVVVLRSNAGSYLALQVDQVLGEQEIVIKQLEGPVPKPIGIAGATVLGDGRIMPIADVLELIDLSMGRLRREAGNALWEKGEDVPVEPTGTKSEPTVLIVDDSITVRELLSMTFNKVGYRVEQARDGQEAWEKLRSGLPCDLVFCDIEMPRMDGLELLSRMQKDPHLNHLPIAMLTSRGADRHRQMAIQLGAKGYFTKPYLEEALLDAAQRMLKGEVLVSMG